MEKLPRTVLSASDMRRALNRIACEILETNKGTENLLILGIPTRGVVLAKNLATYICKIEKNIKINELFDTLEVSKYRDDLNKNRPKTNKHPTIFNKNVDNKNIILVDDVLYSGRTVRAALDALTQLGRPAKVRLAVLIDRGHRQLPIRADYVGKNLPTATSERVYVKIAQYDEVDEVIIL